MLEDRAVAALPDLQAAMQGDERLQTRIVAAEAVAKLGDPAEAVALLADLSGGEHPWQIQLQAINALTYMGAAAAPALAAVQRATENDQEYVRNAGRYLLAVLTDTYTPSTPIFDLQRMFSKGPPGGEG